jgi:hypothetical protein
MSRSRGRLRELQILKTELKVGSRANMVWLFHDWKDAMTFCMGRRARNLDLTFLLKFLAFQVHFCGGIERRLFDPFLTVRLCLQPLFFLQALNVAPQHRSTGANHQWGIAPLLSSFNLPVPFHCFSEMLFYSISLYLFCSLQTNPVYSSAYTPQHTPNGRRRNGFWDNR